MREFKNRVFLLLIVIVNNVGYSQTYSSIDSTNFMYFHQTDSSFNELTFGAAGSLSRGLFYNENNKVISQTPFFVNESLDLPSFDIQQPVVDVTYFLGPNQEQFFSVFHSQNIKQGVNYAIHFLKNNYDGYYQNQATNHNFFQSNFTYNPSNSLYSAKLYYKHHRYFHEQNGGIQNDSNFTEDVFFSRNRLLMDVNLSDAFSKDILHKVGLNQKLILSNKRDSSNVNRGQELVLDFLYSGQSRTYFDSISGNYDWLSILDTNATYDTLLKNNIKGELAYNFNKEKDSSSSSVFTLGISYNIINHINKNIDTSFYNLNLRSVYKLKFKNGQFTTGGSYFLSGYREGDFIYNAGMNYKVKKVRFFVNGKFENITPAYELLRYAGNHSYWLNSFTDQQILNISGGMFYNTWNLSANYTDIFDPIFLNYLGLPEQFDGVTQVIQTQISKKLDFNKLKINPSICYQYQGGLNIYRLPEWVGLIDVSYNFDAFKSALKLNIGMQAKMYSDFYLMDYAPDIGMFFISNERLQNAYAVADFYLNAKIQSVKFSFSITHANAGLMGYNYFSALHYPFPDRYFKMGLSWMFLN